MKLCNEQQGMRVSNSWQIGLVTLLALDRPSVSSVCAAEPQSKLQETVSPQDLSKFVGWLDFFQKRNAQKYAVRGANHIDESAYVKIGGVDQWVKIRGQDRTIRCCSFFTAVPVT
jgi:hypothetical protein